MTLNCYVLKGRNLIKASLLGLMVIMLAASCQRASQVKSETTPDVVAVTDTIIQNSEMQYALERAAVLERVKGIYSVIHSDYMSQGGVFDSELFDKAYCSKSWNQLLMAIRCKEEQNNRMFFEINHWSMTRYSGIVVDFDEFEVATLSLEPEKRATVNFTVYEPDTYTPASIDLVYEDGRWMIDDFHNLKYMLDVKDSMWDFLVSDLV